MDMSIAAMSVNLNQAKLWQDVGIAMLDKAIETDSQMIEEALKIGSLDPNLGNNIDISI